MYTDVRSKHWCGGEPEDRCRMDELHDLATGLASEKQGEAKANGTLNVTLLSSEKA